MNEVALSNIENLTDIQLSQLLHKLLVLEASASKLEEWEHSVPFNITTGDGGEDGKMKCSELPKSNQYLKNKFTIFQNKATSLFPSDCYEEIMQTQKKDEKTRVLKSQIKKLVEEDGCYTLFTNIPIVEKGKEERIAKFREAIKDAGHPNHETFQIEVFDANKIKDWCNEYIAAVTLVQGFNSMTRPYSFMTWEQWEAISRARENIFQKDSVITDNENSIKESISSEKVIRITGHSGLGKTRLVLESFRESDLKESVVYYDLAGIVDIAALKGYIISHQDTQSGIIVVDNCDVKSHNILSAIAKPFGDIKLVTIGLDDNTSVEDLKVKIEREKQRDLVRQIVENKIGGTHTSSDKDYIAKIAEGYPWMAIRFCDIITKEGMKDLSKIPIDQFIEKLIFGSADIEYNVIRACSVFSSFGFVDDSFRDVLSVDFKDSLEAQKEFIRTRICEDVPTEIKFNEVCQKFLQEDIIERRGVYYVVKPTILAISLASQWLVNTNSKRIKEIIEDLRGVGLEEKFVDRLKDLDQIDKAKDIVAEMWGGGDTPFGTAEVLNTSWGSLLFRYVVEVNPIATTKALFTAFGNADKSELESVKEGRRNLIWALEKLCFRKETFKTASKILYAFAVAENETWGNNATNQFVHLFQIILAGTEATLQSRMEIIEWGLNKDDNDYTNLALQALNRGLQNHHFSRMGSANQQGGGIPLKDYQPSDEEIQQYHEKILEILSKIARSDSAYNQSAKKIIASSIRGLLSHWEIGILTVVKEIISDGDSEAWLEVRQGLKDTLRFETHLSNEIIEEIKSILASLTPSDLRNKFLLIVSKPEWSDFSEDENGKYINRPELNAIDLAQNLIESGEDWVENIKYLVEGEQRQGFSFGREIGKLSEDLEKIIDIAINEVKHVEAKSQNIEFITGVLTGSSNKVLCDKISERFINDEELRHHSFIVVLNCYSKLADLEKLFVLIDKFNYPITHFQIFMYGRALEKLSSEDVRDFCGRISKYGNSGKWTALALMFMYCFSNEELWQENLRWFRQLVLNTNMLVNNDKQNRRTEGYHWSQAVEKLLKNTNDTELAAIVASQIVEFCGNANFDYSLDNDALRIIILLVDQYFTSVWEIFGNAIIGDGLTFFHLKNLIGVRNGNMSPRQSVLFKNHAYYDEILDFCRKYPTIAPKRIANMMPLNVTGEEDVQWNPFSLNLINEFGDNQQVLDELSANMGSFGSSGSSIPYYQTQKKLLETLLDNRNQKVRDWASGMLDYTDKAIKRENLNDEQRFVV